MNQILLGIIIPFVIALFIYLARGRRASVRMLVILPICMCVSALWAVAPDLPRLFGYHDLYYKLSNNPHCNIFYWHYTIDMIETDSTLYLAGFIFTIMALLAGAWRELYLAEKEQ